MTGLVDVWKQCVVRRTSGKFSGAIEEVRGKVWACGDRTTAIACDLPASLGVENFESIATSAIALIHHTATSRTRQQLPRFVERQIPSYSPLYCFYADFAVSMQSQQLNPSPLPLARKMLPVIRLPMARRVLDPASCS